MNNGAPVHITSPVEFGAIWSIRFNNKPIRFWAAGLDGTYDKDDTGNVWLGTATAGATLACATEGVGGSGGSDWNGVALRSNDAAFKGVWRQEDFYMKESTVDVADGTIRWAINGSLADEAVGSTGHWSDVTKTRNSDFPNRKTYFFQQNNVGERERYPTKRATDLTHYAELYADDSWQRVTVGDGSGFMSVTPTAGLGGEHQRLLTWADGTITFKIKGGAKSSFVGDPMYWVDDTNTAHLIGSYT